MHVGVSVGGVLTADGRSSHQSVMEVGDDGPAETEGEVGVVTVVGDISHGDWDWPVGIVDSSSRHSMCPASYIMEVDQRWFIDLKVRVIPVTGEVLGLEVRSEISMAHLGMGYKLDFIGLGV